MGKMQIRQPDPVRELRLENARLRTMMKSQARLLIRGGGSRVVIGKRLLAAAENGREIPQAH